tara:strand:+ start:207 stop:1061 length:855 start_codon:yes stop_codon:yes gene_type:complete
MINNQLEDYVADLGLTQTQLNNKRNYIGGSSAKDIADGNWLKVYEMLVDGKRDDLTKVFKVQLGHVTEEYNLIWFADHYGWDIIEWKYDVAVTNPDYPFIGCLPDALMRRSSMDAIIDAKHSGASAPWWNEQKIAEYYYAQAQHNMIATQVHDFYLSVVFGNEQPVEVHIPYDQEWSANYIDMCSIFWQSIENKQKPQETTAMPKPIIVLGDMRELDMTEGNQKSLWADHANVYIENEKKAKLFEYSKKEIKKMVPEDVKKAFGNKIEINRSKGGALTVKITDE